MTLISQKTPRAALVSTLKAASTLLANDSDGTAHVVGYFNPNPKGISPFCCVDSAGAVYDVNGNAGALTPFRFVVGFWVRRDTDPAAAEDQLDDLALALAQALKTMHNAKFTSDPQSDFEVIEGIPYKFSLHFVQIDR